MPLNGIKVLAMRLFEERGIKLECEECFILTNPSCPDFPHSCALEEALKDPEQRTWTLQNISLSGLKRGKSLRPQGVLIHSPSGF